jgi:hypothetical protein
MKMDDNNEHGAISGIIANNGGLKNKKAMVF